MVKQSSTLIGVYTVTDTLWVTPEHPFYVNGKWTPAGSLKKGNRLTLLNHNQLLAKARHLPRSAQIRIDSIAVKDTVATVYNFTVAKHHNYYVGNVGVLVHNESCYEPDNFEQLFGFKMPDWFWDKMGQKIKVQYTTNRLTSAWNGDKKDLQVVKTWYGLLGASYPLSPTQNVTVLKGTVIHELGHAYHDLTGRIDPFEVNSLFRQCFKDAKKIVEEIKSDSIKKEYLWVTKERKNAVIQVLRQNYNQKFTQAQIDRMYGVILGTFEAITGGELGFGHQPGELKGIKKFKELFAQSADIYFNGNIIMKALFPKLYNLLYDYWENHEKNRK